MACLLEGKRLKRLLRRPIMLWALEVEEAPAYVLMDVGDGYE